MSAAEFRDDLAVEDEAPAAEPLGLAPDAVEVRRNAGLAALIGAVASAVAIAYLARATGTGAVLDWLLASVMGLVGIGHLAALVDARTPLLVADTQGVRIRLGNSWRGLPWGALTRIEHQERRGPLRDGRLVMVVRNPERVIEDLDRRGRRQTRLARRLYGAPFAVPLALSTRVTGAGEDLTAALTTLAGAEARIILVPATPEAEPEPESEVSVEDPEQVEDPTPRRWHDPRPAIAHVIDRVAARLQRPSDSQGDPGLEDDQVDDEVEEDELEEVEVDDQAADQTSVDPGAPATLHPLRALITGRRAEVRADVPEAGDEPAKGGRELRRPGSVNLVEDTVVWGDRVRPISRPGSAVEPLLIDEFAVEPAENPVVGPQLLAARTRLGLTVDQLAERTRIRPHVIESVEVDDFAPCGGDFYARGHLRTLARVLGVDVAPLLVAYDERYADAPINPRRVFEAELATGASGSIRSTRGGPNWSVLVAAVMALVLAWSVARLVMDSPVELRGTTPVLNGSAGVDNSPRTNAPPVPVVLEAAGGGARVVVRDGSGKIVFAGNLAFGQSKLLQVAPPVRVQSTDGSVQTTIDGREKGALGATGESAQNTFTVE